MNLGAILRGIALFFCAGQQAMAPPDTDQFGSASSNHVFSHSKDQHTCRFIARAAKPRQIQEPSPEGARSMRALGRTVTILL